MDTSPDRRVDRTDRRARAKLAAGAKLLIRERLLTEKEQQAKTEFEVEMNGEGAATDLVSRSVARETPIRPTVPGSSETHPVPAIQNVTR